MSKITIEREILERVLECLVQEGRSLRAAEVREALEKKAEPTYAEMLESGMSAEYCPTQSGTFTAYAPEVMHEGKWTAIPIKTSGVNGVPFPLGFSGVMEQIGLCGYEQAMCLAWGYAAVQKAEGECCEVRVQAYAVQYDLKARKVDPATRQGGTE